MTIKSWYYKSFLHISVSAAFFGLTAMEKVTHSPTDESLYTLGISYSGQGKYKEAEECFDKIATESKNTKNRAYALHALGLLYLKQEKYREARWYFSRVLRSYKEVDIIPLYNNLGLAYLYLDKKEKAQSCFDQGRNKGDEDAAKSLTKLIKEKAVAEKQNERQCSEREPIIAESTRKKRKPKKKKQDTEKAEVISQEIEEEKTSYQWCYMRSLDHTALEGHQDATQVRFLFCTADGGRLISITSKYIYVWDTIQGTCIAVKELADKVKPYFGRMYNPLVGWNEKTQELFVVTLTGIVKVGVLDDAPFHLQMSREGKLWAGHTSCGTFNADCSLFAATIEHEGSRFLLYWDIASGHMKNIAKGSYIGTIISLQFSNDSKKLYSVTKNGIIKVWDRELGIVTDVMRALRNEKNSSISCGFINPLGAYAFLGDQNNLKMCPISFTPLVKNGSEEISCVDYTPNGKYLACAYTTGEVILATADGQQKLSCNTGKKAPLCIRISSDGSALFVVNNQAGIQVWKRFDAANEQASENPEVTLVNQQPLPNTFIRARGPSLQYGTGINSVNGLTLREDVTAILCEALTASGTLIFIADGSSILINNCGVKQPQLPIEHKGYIWSLCFLRDRTMLASGGDDCIVRLWDLKTKQCRFVLKGHTQPIWSLVYDDTISALFSGGGDGLIQKWGPEDGTLQKTLVGHTKRVNDLKLFKFNEGLEIVSALASCSDDGTIRIWNRKSDTCLKVLQGHTGPVTHLEYYSKYEALISASEDGTVRFWNIYTGEASTVHAMSDTHVKRIEMNAEEELIHIVHNGFKIDIFKIGRREPAPLAENGHTTSE